MKNIFKRKKVPLEEPMVLSFLDCITPGVLKFETDHYISGNTWRCVWALREYPAATDSQALLGRLGDRRGVTLRIVCRLVTPAEENRIIHNATNRNKLERANTNDLRRVITAESNLQDMASLVGALDREHEPLLYCAVYVEVMADSFENLTIWLSEEAWQRVKQMYKEDDCLTHSEFVEKAIWFYAGYLHTDRASAFLPRVLLDTLEGSLGVFGNRINKLLFNLAVEHSITNHLLAEDADMDAEMYRKYRGYSVREVTDTQGAFSFKDALRLHRRW